MSFAVLLTVTAVTMVGPLLIDIAAALDTTIPIAGQMITVAAATWAVTAMLVGPFSDAYGRKPVLLLGTALLAIGSLGIGLAPNFPVALASGVLIGMGGGMVPPTCIAVIGDIFTEQRRPTAVAILTMQPGLSSVLCVPLAAVLADFTSWRFPFLALAASLLIASVMLFLLIPQQRPNVTQLNLAGRIKWVTTFPVTWYMAGTNTLARIGWGVMITFFPAYLIVTYDLRTVEVALPVAIVALGATAAPLLGGRIARDRRREAITAAILLAAALPGLGVFLTNCGTWSSVFTAALFVLLIVPITTILLILVAELGGASRGTLAGVISSSNWSGTATGAAIGGVLVAQVGYGALAFLLVAAALAAGLMMSTVLNNAAIERARKHFSTAPGAQ